MIHLYVKQHNITGLKYFGKTAVYNPFTYHGSGKYWKRHLEVHDENVSTLAVYTFDNREECTAFAIEYSLKENIVESKDWANLRIENGIDGWPAGVLKGVLKPKVPRAPFMGEEHKRKISEATKGRKFSAEHRRKLSVSALKHTPTKNPKVASLISEANTGKRFYNNGKEMMFCFPRSRTNRMDIWYVEKKTKSINTFKL